MDRFGTIDAFYNNAGIEGDIKPIPDYSLENFRRVLDVNVVNVFLGMKYVLPVDAEAGTKGSIINTYLDRGPDGLADDLRSTARASTR